MNSPTASEQKTLNERLTQAKMRIDTFERNLQRELNQLAVLASHSQSLATVRDVFWRLVSNRNLMLALGGGVVVVWLVSRLFRGSSRRKSMANDVVVRRVPGFWSQLLSRAVQMFLLHYTRKLLLDYLEQNAEKKS
jgi:uncharacterized BrkB/YihY/UPF0761 family membrane protein